MTPFTFQSNFSKPFQCIYRKRNQNFKYKLFLFCGHKLFWTIADMILGHITAFKKLANQQVCDGGALNEIGNWSQVWAT